MPKNNKLDKNKTINRWNNCALFLEPKQQNIQRLEALNEHVELIKFKKYGLNLECVQNVECLCVSYHQFHLSLVYIQSKLGLEKQEAVDRKTYLSLWKRS